MKYLTPSFSMILGAVTGLYYRDELFLPTNMRLKVAVLEYNLLTRQRVNMDLMDIMDPQNARELSMKSREVIERY